MSNNHLINHLDELSEMLLLKIGEKKTFEQLLFNGADINYQNASGWSVLFETIITKENLRLEEFIKLGLDLNLRDSAGRNGLFWAIYSNNFEAFKILLSYDIELLVHNDENLHVLNYCVYKGNLRFLNLLLSKKNININKKDHLQATPLFYAILYKRLDIVDYLLKNGANKYLKDKFGNSAASLAKKLDINLVPKYISA